MNSIMGLIRPELSELFTLEFAKTAESDFVDTVASINVDQLVPNTIYMAIYMTVSQYIVTIYMTMRSWMSLFMGQIRQ